MLQIEIVEVSVTQMGFALMLKPPQQERVVPVFIGPLETYSISNALEGQVTERPMTHDLMRAMLDATDFEVRRVVLNDFSAGTFFARIILQRKSIDTGLEIDLDARPSDAIALALRFNCPIFMAEHVYEKTSVDRKMFGYRADENGEGEDADNPAIQESEADKLIEMVNSLPGALLDPKETESILEALGDEKDKSRRGGDLQSREAVLRQMLDAAVKRERYEDAAQIRDELNSLLSGGEEPVKS